MTASPLEPVFRPSARKVKAKRSFSWPGGPWSTTVAPTGSPPWTSASNPSMPVASRAMGSRFQGSRQAATDGEVRVDSDGITEGALEDAFRGVRSETLGADGPQIAMDGRDELSKAVQAALTPADHLVEHRPPEFLVVRRETVFHLRLDGRLAEVSNSVEQGVEVCHVEVDHFTKRTRFVFEVHFKAEARRSQPVLERPRIVRAAFYEPELREPLEELRRGRDVDFEDPRDLARQNPLSVPQRPQDREAVLAGKEEDRLPERLLVHGTEPSAEPLREVRSLSIVELGSS